MTHEKIGFGSLASAQNSNKIYLDLHFQSKERWSDFQRRKFLKSVLANSCPTPIVLAHVESCMEYCAKTLGTDSADYEYFQKLHAKKYTWISIDGNNRSRAIARFVNDEYALSLCDHKISGIKYGNYEHWKPAKGNRKYSTLPQMVRQHLDDEVQLIVFKVTQATHAELHDLFLAINDGVTLNQQERRNAIVCNLSGEVRKIAEDYISLFTNYWTEGTRDRRSHEEWVVSGFVHVTRTGNINKAERDAAYDNTMEEYDKRKLVRNIIKQMQYLCTLYDTKKKKLLPNEATRFDLFMMLHWLGQNNYKIKNHREFFAWFVETYDTVKNSDKILWKDAKGTNARDYVGVQRSFDSGHRAARLGVYTLMGNDHEVFGDILPALPEDVLVQQDPNKAFPVAWKVPMWRRQNGKCALTGIDIPLSELMDGLKYQMDHIIPRSKGGKTTFDNGQVTCSDENRNKSDSMPVGTL